MERNEETELLPCIVGNAVNLKGLGYEIGIRGDGKMKKWKTVIECNSFKNTSSG